jgi:hypothetical protein
MEKRLGKHYPNRAYTRMKVLQCIVGLLVHKV